MKTISRILLMLGLMAINFYNPAFAFYKQSCSVFGKIVAPQHPGSRVDFAIYEASFTNSEIENIRKAITEWDADNIGNTYLRVNLLNQVPLADRIFLDGIFRNNVPEASRFFLAREYMRERSEAHLIVKLPFPPDDDSAGLAVQFHSDGTTCSANSNSSFWRDGGGILFNTNGRLTTDGAYNLGTNRNVRDINYIAVHEVGHILGLEHPDARPGWKNEEYVPSVMMSGFYDQNHGGLTTFSDHIVTSFNESFGSDLRKTMPYGDDREGIRDIYPSRGRNFSDAAVNQYEFSDRWDNEAFVRNLNIWRLNWYSGILPNSAFNYGSNQRMFIPITAHNLGTREEFVRGIVSLMPVINGNTVRHDPRRRFTEGTQCQFNIPIKKGASTQIRCVIFPPSSGRNNQEYGAYVRLTEERDRNDEKSNNRDLTFTRWDLR